MYTDVLKDSMVMYQTMLDNNLVPKLTYHLLSMVILAKRDVVVDCGPAFDLTININDDKDKALLTALSKSELPSVCILIYPHSFALAL